MLEEEFTYEGIECKILYLENCGYRVGSVKVPDNKVVSLNIEDINCHGGISDDTFSTNGGYWISFDFGHYGDGRDVSKAPSEAIAKAWSKIDGHLYTKEEVKEECIKVAKQLLNCSPQK